MDNLMTTAQLALLLGVDRSTITRRVQAGELTPAYSREGHGGIYLFDPARVAISIAEVGEE